MPNSILLGFSAPNTTEANEPTPSFDGAASPEMQTRKPDIRPELSKQAQYSQKFSDGSQSIIGTTPFRDRADELGKESNSSMTSAQRNSLSHESETINGQVSAENGGNGFQSTYQSQIGSYTTPYAPVLPFLSHPGTGGYLPVKSQQKGDEESSLNSESRLLTTPNIPSHIPLSRQSSFGSPSLFGPSIQGGPFGDFGEQQTESWRTMGIHSPPSSISEPKEFEGPGLNQYPGGLEHSGSASSSSRSSGYSTRSKSLSYSGLKSASMSKFPSPGGVIPGLNKGLTPSNTASIVPHPGSFQAPRRTNSVSKWMSKTDKRNRRRWNQGIKSSEELYDADTTDGLESVSFSRPYQNHWDSKSDIYSEKLVVPPSASALDSSSVPPAETNGVLTPYSDRTPLTSMEDGSYYNSQNGSNGTHVPFNESSTNRDATSQRWTDPYYANYASKPYIYANYPSYFAEQQQRLAAHTAYNNFIPGAPLGNVPVEPATIHSHPGDQSQAILHIEGDLFDMTRDWTMEETKLGRRLVRFEREQRGRVIYLQFEPINPRDYREDMCVISCIWRRETQEYYVTSVNCIALLELIVNQKFSVEEKNRIRRNLEVCKPLTVSKTKSEVASFFRQIMGFAQPRPRNIEKDVKVFLWSTLESALKKIVSKYSAS